MKKKLISVFIIIAVAAGGVLLWHYLFVDTTYYGKMAVDKFYSVSAKGNSEDDMQNMLNELGEYDSYKLNMRKKIIAVWTAYGMSLVGDYSPDNYKKQKQYILDNYQFASKLDAYRFKYEINEKSAYEFDINKWHFMLLMEDDEEYYIPENFKIAAFNDTDNKIAFLYFIDSDLDCFGDNNDEKDLANFIEYYFRYNFRK